MSAKESSPPAGQTTISLNDVADRYLRVYQRLFDVAMFNFASYRKVSEEDYDFVGQQFPVMPHSQSRRNFEGAKDTAQDWLARNLISEALSTVVPLLEDCRTVLALCDYKASGKTDAARIQEITNQERASFMGLPIPEKFKLLKDKYAVSSELQEHIQSLLDVTKCMVMHENKVAPEAAPGGTLVFKIRAITIVQAPAQSKEGGEPILGLTRRMQDHTRELKAGEEIHLAKAEVVGALVTIAGFLATLLQGVQVYAKKVGAAD
jgi:hypothetical protein